MDINIHNIMEEQVVSRVKELYEQVGQKGASWLTCDCENCRLDTICYVLNRLPPRYVVSGRGITHNTAFLKDVQLSADIDRLALEGMKLVSTAKRPYHKYGHLNASEGAKKTSSTPVFNFPTFVGNVYDGSTFEPLPDARILLKEGNTVASMMDSSWLNPCKTFAVTNGSYSFWVAPEVASKEKEYREFNFTLEISADGYDSVTYSFTVPLVSEKVDRREMDSTFSLKVKELFLFRSDIINTLE